MIIFLDLESMAPIYTGVFHLSAVKVDKDGTLIDKKDRFFMVDNVLTNIHNLTQQSLSEKSGGINFRRIGKSLIEWLHNSELIIVYDKSKIIEVLNRELPTHIHGIHDLHWRCLKTSWQEYSKSNHIIALKDKNSIIKNYLEFLNIEPDEVDVYTESIFNHFLDLPDSRWTIGAMMNIWQAELTHAQNKTPRCQKCKAIYRFYHIDIRGGYECWKCQKAMNVILIYNQEDDIPISEDCPICSEMAYSRPKSLIPLAEQQGVILEERYNKTMNSRYIMHICPHCKAHQGDYHIVEDMHQSPTFIKRINGRYCRFCDDWNFE
ncbi:hypothetical protein GTO91_15310 [Heliobacterium undosum]|uniref:Uncharacterized protein n=1 Tax=Heliomicrobium undosum TaxID=121734 RepID=A0A845L386_9FIRM|nr:hypothetical protein [Heliomicrobium undosum]MZP31082.1 hypothetical protein [Heliomicrobium undosum]